ncbi:hypothetical protein [Nocardiopsis sp. FIRDI 009]|uniref:hypothetical protein n=1 Tax=Nocardiopsis sp. FIRDI 009 TaxID=714197 RepID=UPI000E223264|nr:hypothetical protein [Nocardiopsis sp. FIRDI 009]
MGKRTKKPRNKRLGPQNPAAREAAAGFVFDSPDDPIPMTYQGRIITPEVIAQMRAEKPDHAWQLDAEWERAVLDNNQPWLTDQDRLKDTEDTWTQARTLFPDAFADCGCDHPDDEADQAPPRPPEEVRAELWEHLAPTVPTEGLDPVEILLRVEGMSSIEDFEATPPDRWRIDGRPLTKEEMRTVLEMKPTDFMRYHLIQDERQADQE